MASGNTVGAVTLAHEGTYVILTVSDFHCILVRIDDV